MDIFQHTPAMRSVRWSLLQVHNRCSELVEELALKGFSEEISDHLFCGTILDRKIVVVDAVGDEVESAIEMLGSVVCRLLRPYPYTYCTVPSRIYNKRSPRACVKISKRYPKDTGTAPPGVLVSLSWIISVFQKLSIPTHIFSLFYPWLWSCCEVALIVILDSWLWLSNIFTSINHSNCQHVRTTK